MNYDRGDKGDCISVTSHVRGDIEKVTKTQSPIVTYVTRRRLKDQVPAIQDEHKPVKKGDDAKGGAALIPGMFPFPLFGAAFGREAHWRAGRAYGLKSREGRNTPPRRPRRGRIPGRGARNVGGQRRPRTRKAAHIILFQVRL